MARLLALTALVLATASAVGPDPARATTSGSHGQLTAAAPDGDQVGPDVARRAPLEAAPATQAGAALAGPVEAGRPASPHRAAGPALAPLSLAPKTSPPLPRR